MDDLTAVRDLLGAPRPSAEVTAAGRDRLLALVAEPPVRPLPKARRAARPALRAALWSTTALVLAGAAATTVVIASGGAPRAPGLVPGVTAPTEEPSAQRILLAAAASAAKSPSSGTYWARRVTTGTQLLDPTNQYVIEQRFASEEWLSQVPGKQSWSISQYLGAVPATPADEAAWRAAGSPRPWVWPGHEDNGQVFPGMRVEDQPGPREVNRRTGRGTRPFLVKMPLTQAELDSLPTAAEPLRAYLEERITGFAKKWPTIDLNAEMDARVTAACFEIIGHVPTSPQVRSATYQLLSTLPGITATGTVTTPSGQSGQGLVYRRAEAAEIGLEIHLTIDPETGLPLAEQSTSTEQTASGAPVKLVSTTTYDQIGFTDEAPRLS
ncbi:hypothetical protein [Acrocarpospora catenulata]|uniref:hypothetical protein n=1 Tax=Acrocarpospora catenulata TaxID=2836182 RepID=UPI001BDAFA49|nr:hypothetical protein [Acrocarpospora catenulata]